MSKLDKRKSRLKRKGRIRSKIFGTKKIPRLCVTRSLKHIYAQLIDDEKGKTILSATDGEIKNAKAPSSAPMDIGALKGKQKPHKETKKDIKQAKIQIEDFNMTTKVYIAKEVGKLIAKKAKVKKIKKVVFDRSGHKYHGRVKAVADGAREGGLEF